MAGLKAQLKFAILSMNINTKSFSTIFNCWLEVNPAGTLQGTLHSSLDERHTV